MMKFFLLLLLVSLVYSQTNSVWTARTIVTSPQMGSGYFLATVTYDWAGGLMKVAFDNASLYTEFYVFNTDKGYNGGVLTGQFTYQYLYKTSTICPCETTGLQDGMPAWFPSAVTTTDSFSGNTYWVTGGGAAVLDTTSLANGISAYVYYANPAFAVTVGSTTKSYYISNKFWVSTDGTKPAGFQLTDPNNLQRTFTITSFTPATTGLLASQVPTTSCPCSKLIDLVISLDRSGSISIAQWEQEYAFVKNVTQAFTYGPLAVNFGLVNWNANQWTTIDITAGTSASVIDTAIDNMACCPDTASPSCCCCGTPIGGGLWAGGNMLSEGRAKATKVLILLTDGCQNHLWQSSPPLAIACDCASEKACSTNVTCTSDITKWYNWVMTNIPGTKIIAIGVGTSATICTDQLLLVAGGDPTAVYNPQSWTQLQNIVNTISATACSINAVPCTDCCGLCTCGICIPAPQCFNPDKCNIGVFDPNAQCCTSQPVTCTPGACQTAYCDATLGCQNQTVTCKDAETCSDWICNATTIVCQQFPKVPLPAQCSNVTIPQCVTNSDCSQGDPCKVYQCLNSTGKCSVSTLDCGVTDKCTTRYCKPGVGCQTINTTCNDNNVCTIDTCNPTSGCLFTDTSSSCPKSDDGCKVPICDPIQGCMFVPLNCSAYGFEPSAVNCTVPQCNKTCYNQYVCYAPPPKSAESFPQTVIIGSAIGAAAVVGIVVGAAVLVAGLGTAAGVAIAGAAGAGGVALVSHNPTYVPSGASGNNVLFKPKD